MNKLDNNPHIVKFLELLKTQNHYYFIYEFCNGGTLDKLLTSHNFFPESRALLFFSQLVNAFKTL